MANSDPHESLKDHILDEPPKKQGPNGENKIVWLDVAANDKSAQALFSHIRRMRNNLYHGGKFNDTAD
jgi:hypothetical protein